MMRSVCDRKRDTAVYCYTHQPLVTLSSNIQQFVNIVCRSVGIDLHLIDAVSKYAVSKYYHEVTPHAKTST